MFIDTADMFQRLCVPRVHDGVMYSIIISMYRNGELYRAVYRKIGPLNLMRSRRACKVN